MLLNMKFSAKGFTLIELIIFIVVGAIILPASFVAFTSAMRHFSTPDYYAKARFFAEQKIEEITSNNYNCACISRVLNPSGLCQIGVNRYDCSVGTDSDTPETDYSRSWNINLIDSTLNPPASGSDEGYKRIVISITMPDGSTYDVSTIVTKRPKL